LLEAGEGDCQRANRLRRPRAKGRADADEMGRHRPRSDDVVRGGGARRPDTLIQRLCSPLSPFVSFVSFVSFVPWWADYRATTAMPHGRVPALTFFTALVARSMNDTSFD